MKKLVTLCLLIFTIFSAGYGQTIEKIAIPVLKEDPKVDKLMDIILGAKKAVDQNTSYILELFKGNDGSYAYQVKKIDKADINIMVNQRIGRLDMGCFKYRKYDIIVWTNSDFSDLITKTSQSITLDTVYKLGSVSSKTPRDFDVWHYLYQNGRFVTEDGPPSIN
ncbi:hypothetical protein HQ865_18100 [Mucilaginibacter mali]|uniref:Uncharacterized protein n=1 Tax=Mucilaginibacter mali TaxID=2740462 RepID=A0A7D4TWN3_9SPHI|nr:hypothetical protein [Mucilaginibacter mali]QKJ31595.1 hypothetical protein HQ865_18100 [Mucilaginibacter mali]